jgi:hypothetical protein
MTLDDLSDDDRAALDAYRAGELEPADDAPAPTLTVDRREARRAPCAASRR